MKKILCLLICLVFASSSYLESSTSLQKTQASTFSLSSSYHVDTVWATAYQVTVTLLNNTQAPTTSWTSTFTLPNANILSTHTTSGTFTTNGLNVTVKSLSSNAVLAPGQSTTYSMIIDMPQSGSTTIKSLNATANSSVTPPPAGNPPAVPVLNSIATPSSQSYTISWNSVATATSYLLQQDTSSSFSNPTTIVQSNVLSYAFTNQPAGTYYYRVSAQNANGSSTFSNVQSVKVTVTTPPTKPVAPVLDPISTPLSQSYTISWDSVATATSYLLQQDTTNVFSNPTTIVQGNVLSHAFTNQPAGTYYYRVSAQNATGTSPFSNVESVTVTATPPVNPIAGIEHSVWYIDWTSWFPGPTFVLPTGVNMINVFVGEITYDANGNPTMDGFGNLTPQLKAFSAYCAAQNPPIAVKVSIGGGGGMYDRCWDVLTTSNISDFAKGMADFCHANGLVGVDFDYEAFSSSDQETLVGELIKAFKAVDPTLQTSLCTNAGFGPNFPWQASTKNILDAATISTGNNAVDRLYVMSYYDPMASEETWVLGWANWVETNYGFTPNRVSVGIDDFDAHAYDPVAFAAWAAANGFSTAHWAFDPAHPQ